METLTIILLICVLVSTIYVLQPSSEKVELKKEETNNSYILIGGILSVGIIWALYISNSIQYLTNKANDNNTYIEQQLQTRDYTKNTINSMKREIENYKANSDNLKKAIHDIHYLRKLFLESTAGKEADDTYPIYELLSEDFPQQPRRSKLRPFTGNSLKLDTHELREDEREESLQDKKRQHDLTEWFNKIKAASLQKEIKNSEIALNSHNYEMYKIVTAPYKHTNEDHFRYHYIEYGMYIIVKSNDDTHKPYIAVKINREIDVLYPLIY